MNNKIKKNDYQIVVKNLWKVFGDDPLASLSEEYLLKSRSEIQSEIGQLIALRNISFNVKRGETFVVMGLSGSGKSTLVRCLIRLIEKTSGNISVDGEDINSFDDKNLMDFRRNKVSMVFQNFGLLPHRNVIDNACYGLEIKGIPKKERHKIAKKMISLVGLDGWEYSKVSELSGGMQQRVGLARALAVEPEILLLDEPFSGLDPLIRRQMRSELVDLQKKLKKTMVFITHDLDEAVRVGHRIAIMRDGAVVQIGTPEEIVVNPADEYVADFVKGISRLKVVQAKTIMQSIKDYENKFEPLSDDNEIVDENDVLSKLIETSISKDKPIIVSNKNKQKGNRFEREVVKMCEQADIPAKRSWGSDGRSLGMHEEVDVLIDSDIRVQAKVRKKIATWLQPSNEVDLQVVKQDRGEVMVVMRFDDWLADYRRLLELEKRL